MDLQEHPMYIRVKCLRGYYNRLLKPMHMISPKNTRNKTRGQAEVESIVDPSRNMEQFLEYCIGNKMGQSKHIKNTQERRDHIQDDLEKVEEGYR